MNSASLRERAGIWFLQYGDSVGLVVAVALVLSVGIAGLALTRPVGPSRTVVGIINAIWLPPSKTGPRPAAEVQLSGEGVHRLRLIPGNACKVGDPVTVVETPQVWGVDRQVRPIGCNR